jgi:hypothetical protein
MLLWSSDLVIAKKDLEKGKKNLHIFASLT